MRQVFRPGGGKVLTVCIGLVSLISLVLLAVRTGWDALPAVPWLTLVAGTCWALFWRPEVVVDDGGVRLVNVFRTVDLPWPSIHLVDTKWALTLRTAYGRYTAWAAPAPGVRETMRATRSDVRNLPSSTNGPGGIRPGDLPSSASGSAAVVIRRHWEELRNAGHLEDPRLEHARAPVAWHIGTMAAGAVLCLLAVFALLV